MQARRARQLVIALLLRARGKLRAADLAAVLHVSARTIARDCAELELLGVPVIADRGAAGGLRLLLHPPLDLARFAVTPPAGQKSAERSASTTVAEIERLRLSVRDLIERMDRDTRAAIEEAFGSLVLSATTPGNPLDADILLALRRALWRGRRVRIVYPTRGRPHTRDVDPLALVVYGDVWYLAGYCHWREDVRTFTVSRITSAQPLEDVAPAPQQAHLAGETQG